MSHRFVLLVAVGLMLNACAFGDETLNLAYDSASAKPGVLSQSPAATIAVSQVVDERLDRNVIGYKRNGYGAKTADILSAKPATELVHEALVTTLEKNGHKIGGEGDRHAVKTTLRKFWFDYKTGLVSVEFYGNVQAEVTLVDQTSGDTLFREVFEGYHSEKTGGGLSKTWTRVMNAALADFVAKVNLSPDFKDAVAKASAAQSGPAVSSVSAAELPGS